MTSVNALVSELMRLKHNPKAMYDIRSSLGRSSGISQSAYPYVAPYVTPGDPHEKTLYQLAALFAEVERKADNGNRKAKSIGAALACASGPDGPGERLIVKLTTCRRETVSRFLTDTVRYIYAHGGSVWWIGLFADITSTEPWRDIQRRWAHDFYSQRNFRSYTESNETA